MSLGSFTMEILALVDAVDVDRLAKDVAVLHDAERTNATRRYTDHSYSTHREIISFCVMYVR